ncbi:MAG: RluA family pseudouridine synthase [Armatimonadetes bacterium]|nr:RluA family pseudouridine synthase [Armatimonadota bacterium]
MQKIKVKEKEARRLDLYLIPYLNLSRSQIKNLILKKNILINNLPAKPSYKVNFEDEIEVFIPELEESKITPLNLILEILYEDKDLLVINKPQGLVVHPAKSVKTKTLVNALIYHCKDLSGIGGVLRPGIVHRLDKDTSGIMVIAKNDKSHLDLSNQFSQRKIKKEYLALIHGTPKGEKGEIASPIGRHPKMRKKMAVISTGKLAKTYFEIIEKFKDFTLIKVKIFTGRTHQIRVHLNSIGHPVVGDQTYGKKSNLFGINSQMLHAEVLGFIHPETKEYLEFKAVLPERFKEILKILKKSA